MSGRTYPTARGSGQIPVGSSPVGKVSTGLNIVQNRGARSSHVETDVQGKVPPEDRSPSSATGRVRVYTRVADDQSSTDDQVRVPLEIKLEIIAIIASALAMIVMVGLGIAPFAAIIAAVIFTVSVVLLIHHVKEAFAETGKAFAEFKQVQTKLDNLSKQADKQQGVLGEAQRIVGEQQNYLETAMDEVERLRGQVSNLNAQVEDQRAVLGGIKDQAEGIAGALEAYANAAEELTRGAFAQISENMNQALRQLGGAESEIGAQIEGMRRRVNAEFTGIRDLVAQQREALSAGLGKCRREDPNSVRCLLRVIEQTLAINADINTKLQNLQAMVSGELSELQGIIVGQLNRVKEQMEEAQRKVTEKQSEVESLRTQRRKILSDIDKLRKSSAIASAKTEETAGKIRELEAALERIDGALASAEGGRATAAAALEEAINGGNELVDNIGEIHKINGQIENTLRTAVVGPGIGRRLAGIAGGVLGALVGRAVDMPVAGAVAGASLGEDVFYRGGNLLYNGLRGLGRLLFRRT
ncbi:MAG: hypothetical protein LBF94_02590 [Puniceicoccales bacterium]|jgi:methyl-accepting chemotaxis protein|nr:hypothetical protein [Puniceicoccales bacterium]